jgi:outer membrane immunogenic protein
VDRLSTRLIVAISTLALAPVAMAADLPLKAPPYQPPPPSWTGFYIGANIGGVWGDPKVNYEPNDLVSLGLFKSLRGAPLPASIDTSGVLGGLQAGYNWQIGSALIGAEADIDWSDAKGSVSREGTIGTIAPFANSVVAADKVKWLGTVRARLGYLPTPNLLVFGTGGFAYGEVEHSGAYTASLPTSGILIPVGYDCFANVPCFSGSTSNTAFGWTVGGGLEYAIARNWTIRGEYLYVNLESTSFTEAATSLPFLATVPSSFTANFSRTKLNIARAALNYRF